MALYPALYALLVSDGPLDHLFWDRLPKDNGGKPVVVAAVQVPGTGPEYALGSEDASESATGIANDGGLLRRHSGVTFHSRSNPGRELAGTGTLERVARRLEQLRGTIVTLPEDLAAEPFDTWEADHGEAPTAERLDFAVVADSPQLLEQDSKERLVHVLRTEIWHAPPPSSYELQWPSGRGIRWPSGNFIDWPGI